MIIFYTKENVLTLPIKINGEKKDVVFLPGKNEIDEAVYSELLKTYQKKFDACYKKIIKPFTPKEGIETDKATGKSIIMPEKLSEKDMVALVKNTMDIESLEVYDKSERLKSKAKISKKVLRAIKEQIDEILKIEEKLKRK